MTTGPGFDVVFKIKFFFRRMRNRLDLEKAFCSLLREDDQNKIFISSGTEARISA